MNDTMNWMVKHDCAQICTECGFHMNFIQKSRIIQISVFFTCKTFNVFMKMIHLRSTNRILYKTIQKPQEIVTPWELQLDWLKTWIHMGPIRYIVTNHFISKKMEWNILWNLYLHSLLKKTILFSRTIMKCC